MKLLIDATTRVPIADQIVAGVQAWIRDNDVRPGAKLPSIRQLAADYGISRFPVIEAYDRLVSLGLLDSRHGSGFYVAESNLTGRDGRGWSDPRRAEAESKHIFEQFSYPDGMLKLGGGFVPADWRDVEGLTQAIRQVSRTDTHAVIDYSSPLGNTALRHQVMMRARQLGIQADQPNVLITAGTSQAIDLVMRHLLKPGDTVFVEDPGYYTVFGLLRLHGVKLVGIPRRSDGPDVEVTEAMLREHRPKLFFINSVLQNPTGSVVSPPVAFRLLELARRHGFTFLEDDIFADLQADPTARLATLDQLDHVIYVGGFSKTVSASLPVGYLIAKRELVHDLTNVKMLTSVGGSRFAEAVVSTLLERGAYRKYVERLRQRAGDSVIASLDVLADAGWEVFHHPSGGNFLWARVPHVEDSRDLAATAEKHGVTLAPGHYFRPNLEVSPWVRINSAYATEPRAMAFLQEAGRRPSRKRA